ncbi:MAG: type II toxin-antitoxin system PemK/MazF family toxin [Cyanobacteria bacterium P01_D01_bin.36]
MYRGEIWWADLPTPIASEPGYRHPVLVVQADSTTRTKINTVIVVVLTSTLRLAELPGNVLLPKNITGLKRDSVANVSQLSTIDKTFLTGRIGFINERLQSQVDEGLRLVLYLGY